MTFTVFDGMKIIIPQCPHLSPQHLHTKLASAEYEISVADDDTSIRPTRHRTHTPDIIILDGTTHPAKQLSLCRDLRAKRSSPSPYIILLVDKKTDSNIVASLEAGADDCLVLPIDLDELCARIHVGARWVRANRNLTREVRTLKAQLKKGQQHKVVLMRQATTDGVTGLYTRQYFMTRLFQEMRRSQRYGAPLCILMIDLDSFKQVNDTFGHVTGDRVLSTVAEIARTATRESDIAGRYGGDEICVVLPEITLEHTQAIAERICNQIASIEFAAQDGTPFHMTCSIGVAQREDGIKDSTTFLEAADQALYEAKAAGRNCWVAATI